MFFLSGRTTLAKIAGSLEKLFHDENDVVEDNVELEGNIEETAYIGGETQERHQENDQRWAPFGKRIQFFLAKEMALYEATCDMSKNLAKIYDALATIPPTSVEAKRCFLLLESLWVMLEARCQMNYLIPCAFLNVLNFYFFDTPEDDSIHMKILRGGLRLVELSDLSTIWRPNCCCQGETLLHKAFLLAMLQTVRFPFWEVMDLNQHNVPSHKTSQDLYYPWRVICEVTLSLSIALSDN